MIGMQLRKGLSKSVSTQRRSRESGAQTPSLQNLIHFDLQRYSLIWPMRCCTPSCVRRDIGHHDRDSIDQFAAATREPTGFAEFT
jgi:hypothetical protein